MLPTETAMNFSIPPKLDALYENFKLITETASHHVFEAKKRNLHEKNSIRILHATKDLVKSNFDSAATLFKQELLYLHTRYPGSVLINTLEINEARMQIACAVRLHSLVTPQLHEIQQFIDLNNPKVIEKLLNDVIFDVEFLWKDLKMKNIASIMEPENIYYLKEKGTFFLGNWGKITEENPARSQDITCTATATVESSELRSRDIAAEIRALAFALLKIKKVDVKELELLLSSKKFELPTYDAAVKSTVAEGFNDSQKLQGIVERMLSLDPRNLPNLEEFKIKEDKIQLPFEEVQNEANKERKEVGNQIAIKESKIEKPPNSITVDSSLISTRPTLLAWCSSRTNKVSIIDLKTKKKYVTFDGARISDPFSSWTHVKEIPNTKLLVSLHHDYWKSTNMEIFDISKKGKANKIYSFEVSGTTRESDATNEREVTYNYRRGILGAIPVPGRITYHLFTMDPHALNTKELVKLSRKTKWHSQYGMKWGSYYHTNIASFDFNPAGESIATITGNGTCLISDVNTNNYGFHLQLGDSGGFCRWSTNTGEPFLFVQYGWGMLDILDVEKKVFLLSKPVEGVTSWIDVCQSNANLLVSAGGENSIRIFDKRESKIVKTFEESLYIGSITCVRWNPSGDRIASSYRGEMAKMLDFKTGKVLYYGATADGNPAMSVCFI